MYFKRAALAVVIFMAGLICGGYLFSKSEPRSILEVTSCNNRCYKPNEVAGLIMSAAILRGPFVFPNVVRESDTCLAIRHPIPWDRIHYVLFPKKDIRNITTLTLADTPYVMGCLAMIRDLVLRDKLDKYRVHTNGPGYQDVAYLHFHLIAR
jgi:diadenosine tetraphosphate (Ap4A) HIT family hydrolase